MSEIPEPALEKAESLLGWNTEISVLQGRDNVAHFIADVSEKAKVAQRGIYGLPSKADVYEALRALESLILPNPEDDLLKEAREICAQDAEANNMPGTAEMYRLGELDTNAAMRCTIAALKGRK